jgi:Major tropism determinant N-terminal domain
MSVQVKRRRDTAANVSAYTGAQGELIVDTTNNRVTIHDSVTPGGWAAAKLSEVITNARTAVADAAYTALTTDRSIAYAALTAARTVTLPASADYPTGTPLTIFDESGSCSSVNILTIAGAGTDTIDGAASASIATPYGYLALASNGAGKWTIVDQSLGSNALEQVVQGPNGSVIQFQILEQTVTLSGASTTAGTPIPANCIVLGVGCRVLTAVSGAPSFGVGTSGNATQFGGSLNVAAGSTNDGIVGPYGNYLATNLIVTATSGGFTAGTVRLSIHCLVIAPPAS